MRWRRVTAGYRRRAGQPRALSEAERVDVLEMLHSDRFVDESPATVWETLLDEGTYLASPATMYRLLRATHGGVVERRRQATHPPRSRPELVAEIQARRANVLDTTYTTYPERFVKGPPTPPALPDIVYINPHDSTFGRHNPGGCRLGGGLCGRRGFGRAVATGGER